MPILWRYLLSHYLRVFFFCTFAFIAILLTMRLNEIAHFATLGAEGKYVLWFTLYQIPYILPLAIPIACLISSIILIQRLSDTHELTALRASGFSIHNILTPLLLASAFVCLGNFYIVSEMATSSHLSTGLLKSELRSMNPLLLLNNKHLMRMKGYYVDTLGSSRVGENASDIVIGIPNKSNERISLVIAKNLKASAVEFSGEGVTLISSLPAKAEQSESLIVENMASAATTIQDFSQMIQKKVWSLNNDHLKLGLLLAKHSEDSKALMEAQAAGQDLSVQKQIRRNLNRVKTEIIRRISIALSVVTFTLMGAAFGISINRHRSNRGVFIIIGLAAIFLFSYFTAKGIDHLFIASTLAYLLPHLLIILMSIWALNRASKGVE